MSGSYVLGSWCVGKVQILTDEQTDLMVWRGHKKHVNVFSENTSLKNPAPAAVLRRPCPPPHCCLLPLATAVPKTLPPLTTTPTAACHLTQHNGKGGGGTSSIAASSLLPLANNDKGGEARQQPLPPTTTRGDEVAACHCHHRHPSIEIAKRCLCCNGTC